MAVKSHVDNAPYVEQSGRLDELEASFSVNANVDPPQALWTCPVCQGPPQADPIGDVEIVGVDLPPLDLICHCGHEHGAHGGCGYGATVTLPASVLGGS